MFICGSPWGIGSYPGLDDEYVYGYPPKGMNPYLYTPDPDACSTKEIEAWEEAKKEWNKTND